MIILFMREPVSSLQENDACRTLIDSSSEGAACPSTHAREVPIIRGPGRLLTGAGMIHKIE